MPHVRRGLASGYRESQAGEHPSEVQGGGDQTQTLMNQSKMATKKDDEEARQSGREAKAEAPKKSGQKAVARPKKADAPRKAPKKPGESGASLWINRSQQYLREVSSELRKVVWPSRKETLGSTAVVLVIVFIVSVYLGVVDAILSRLVRFLVG